jgi:NhaC family Na+:H+ antiporter
MNQPSEPQSDREPSLLDAVLPVGCLVAMLAASVYLYGADSSYGANQIALLVAAGVAVVIGLKNGLTWKQMEDGIVHSIGVSMGAILILLSVGALIGTWILSGTVPTLIHYGLEILHPSIFYAAACVICAIVSLSIGSSWTTAGTLGVALIGVGAGLGLSPAVTAGAIISGAYFGDKMSPLSDTTNLAPAVVGSELFTHIRHMMWTTIPSIAIALFLFVILGLTAQPDQVATEFGGSMATLGESFNLGWHLLIPLAVVMFLAGRRWPAFPTMMIGALLGGVFAIIFQPEAVIRLAGDEDLSRPMALVSGMWKALFDGYVSQTGVAAVDDLLSRGGMSYMLNTVWLILCAMTFGGAMERAGLLERLVRGTLKMAKSTGSLIAATLGTSVGTNIVAADQYIAIVLPGRLYREEFKRRGLAPVNLSRAIEDAGTITSPLIPWNTCGAYMAATLGVATFAYLPFALFNLINPIMAGLYAYWGVKIQPLEPEPVPQEEAAS